MKRNLLIAEFARSFWALEPSTLSTLTSVLRNWSTGTAPSADTLAQIRADQGTRGARRGAAAQVAGGIAVLPLYGIITQRGNQVDNISGPGGCSTQQFTQSLRAALADPAVGQILIDIDSPGGAVTGTPELAAEIFNSRGKKPIIGIANSLAASAAYWIGTQCNQLYCTPSGEVGSLGVYCQHVDESQALEAAGLVVSTISAGQFKTELASNQPLSPEARAALQKSINTYYNQFTADVARGCGVPVAKVVNGFGQGRCLTANDALAAGMINGVATFDEVIARMRSKTIGQLPTGSRLASAKAALALAYPPKTANRNQLALQLMKA